MAITLGISYIFVNKFNMEITYSMLLAMTIGFIIIASLGYALLRQYFTQNSKNYKDVLQYIVRFRKLIYANTLYTVGLFIHNFVFWTTDLRTVIVKSFVYAHADLDVCCSCHRNIFIYDFSRRQSYEKSA